MQLQQVFESAEEIAVYKDGSREVYPCGGEKFNGICLRWNAMLANSLVMPAFGVSLNDITLQAMQRGVWVEFCFSDELVINELPFLRLLVEVKPDFSGFNVVRYTADRGYAGRCFYLDLRGSDMRDVYNYISQ